MSRLIIISFPILFAVILSTGMLIGFLISNNFFSMNYVCGDFVEKENGKLIYYKPMLCRVKDDTYLDNFIGCYWNESEEIISFLDHRWTISFIKWHCPQGIVIMEALCNLRSSLTKSGCSFLAYDCSSGNITMTWSGEVYPADIWKYGNSTFLKSLCTGYLPFCDETNSTFCRIRK